MSGSTEPSGSWGAAGSPRRCDSSLSPKSIQTQYYTVNFSLFGTFLTLASRNEMGLFFPRGIFANESESGLLVDKESLCSTQQFMS